MLRDLIRTGGQATCPCRQSQPHHVRRLAVGPVEFALWPGKQPYLDVLFPFGSLLTATWKRDPAAAIEHVRRVRGTDQQTSHVLVNSRLLFLGAGGANLVEIGVWHVGGVLTWMTDDMRRIARGHRPLSGRGVAAVAPCT